MRGAPEEEEEESVDQVIPASLEGEGGEAVEGVPEESVVPEVPEEASSMQEEASPEEEKQRHAIQEEEVTAPELPAPAPLPVEEVPSPEEQLLLPQLPEGEEPLLQPPPEGDGAPSVPLEYEEWKKRWDAYWERWGRGEENLGPPPELPPWLSPGSTQWQENIHSEQPPACTVCKQYWALQEKMGVTNGTAPPECTVCEEYWREHEGFSTYPH